MRSMRQELTEGAHLWSRIIPFKENFPQNRLAEDVCSEGDGAAGGQREPGPWGARVGAKMRPGWEGGCSGGARGREGRSNWSERDPLGDSTVALRACQSSLVIDDEEQVTGERGGLCSLSEHCRGVRNEACRLLYWRRLAPWLEAGGDGTRGPGPAAPAGRPGQRPAGSQVPLQRPAHRTAPRRAEQGRPGTCEGRAWPAALTCLPGAALEAGLWARGPRGSPVSRNRNWLTSGPHPGSEAK